MIGGAKGGHGLGSKALPSGLLLVSLLLSAMAGVPAASAQTQYIAVTPNYINLGMTTSIAVTAPAAGPYTLVVQPPTGSAITLPLTFTAAGQVQTNVFGSAASGFNTVVKQVGVYNIYLEQGSTIVSSNSFNATNQINITFTTIYAGLCVITPGGTRGQEMLAQFHVTYASNGAVVVNAPVNKTVTAANVTYTLPDGTVAAAKYHAGSNATWPQPWYTGHVWPAWNSTWVGTYVPTVRASDQYGNVGTYKYVGYPFIITPITLSTSVSLSDAKTGQLVTGLYNGQAAVITANILYPSAANTVPGTAGPLDSAVRGGVVTAMVGWGPYNATTNAFGSSKQPGGLIATVPMTYSTTTKTWTGPLNVGTLPQLVNASAYQIIVSSHDRASPPNTGFAAMALPPATVQVATASASASTSTATSVSVVTSTVSSVTTSILAVQAVSSLDYGAYGLLLVVAIGVAYVIVLLRSKPKAA